MRIVKGLMSADALCAAAAMIARTVRPYEVAVHLRFATHGAKSPEMCHPFACEWGALVHNGVMRGPGLVARAGESDTAAAARIVSRVEVRAAAALIRDAWLSGSRVLLMRNGADPVRLGEWCAATVPGLMLSQDYSLPELVAASHKRERARVRQSYIWPASSGASSGSALLDAWRGDGCGGWDAEAAGAPAGHDGDTLRDDVAAAQEAARVAAADRAEEARERRAIASLGAARRKRERRALGMGPAAPAAVRAAGLRGDPETLAAVEGVAADPAPLSLETDLGGAAGGAAGLPPMSDGQAAADLGLSVES